MGFDFVVGECVRYGDEEGRVQAVVIGFRRTRVVIRISEWNGERDVVKAVRPYRVVKEGGSRVQASLLGDESVPVGGDVQRVFVEWQQATGRGRVALDAKRTTKIAAALKLYPLDDVLDAVRGWQNEPFYCGENDRHTIYNEISLLLRDAEHVERFRDMWRAGKKAVKPTKGQARQTAHDVRRAIAMGEIQ